MVLVEGSAELISPADRCFPGRATLGIVLEIVKRTDDMKGFKVLPRRWVVERIFSWLVHP